jgi:hypothetical protein
MNVTNTDGGFRNDLSMIYQECRSGGLAVNATDALVRATSVASQNGDLSLQLLTKTSQSARPLSPKMDENSRSGHDIHNRSHAELLASPDKPIASRSGRIRRCRLSFPEWFLPRTVRCLERFTHGLRKAPLECHSYEPESSARIPPAIDSLTLREDR